MLGKHARKRLMVGGMAATVVTGVFFAGSMLTKVEATTNLPADKVTVAASNLQVVPAGDTVILSAQMRTSTTADLILQLTLECSILTQVSTTGTATSSASGSIRSWVTIDNVPVPVVSLPSQQNNQKPPTPADNGQVTFCNRDARQTVTDGDSPGVGSSDTITEYLQTKEANGFNWAAFNIGNGIHTLQVHASLAASSSNPPASAASGYVGNRTLVVQPTSLALNQSQ